MGMWKKNPNHLNKYKGTATEHNYKHNQLQQFLYSWTDDCSEEKKKKLYINFHIYIFKLWSVKPIHMHSAFFNICDVNVEVRRWSDMVGTCFLMQTSTFVP